jgi:hypothetical protein
MKKSSWVAGRLRHESSAYRIFSLVVDGEFLTVGCNNCDWLLVADS